MSAKINHETPAGITIHDILVPRQMEPMMTACTPDGVIAFETLPFQDPYMGWSKTVWTITRLAEDNYVVTERWGSTSATGLSFAEDFDAREVYEEESLFEALKLVYSARRTHIQETGRILDLQLGDATP